MANGYDRDGGGSFVMGFLTGAVLGAGLGMLFAPKAGSDLRRELGEQAGNLANNASEAYRQASTQAGNLAGKAQESAGEWADKASDAVTDWADRGKDLYGKTRDAVAKGVDEGERAVRKAGGVS